MLFSIYKSQIIDELQKKLGTRNVMDLPRVKKVSINMRVSEARESSQVLEEAMAELAAITGQKPEIACAKRSVAGFKVRKNDPLALKVTLRGERALNFLEKLFFLVLPRLRDFKGLSVKQFDQGGNFNIGLRDHSIFPEIDINKIKKGRGLQVTIVTMAPYEKARVLLEILGLPLAKEN